MNFKKSVLFIFVAVVFLFSLTACTPEPEVIPVDTSVPTMKQLSGNTISLEHKLGNNIITTTYNLGDYKLENWRITDSKSISMKVGVKELQEGTEILIEHLHADVSIKATDPQLNGLTQDSMDNSYHGTSQDGFFINEKYSYENIFAIEGFSKDIIDGWMFVSGGYGSGSITTERLTEKNLMNAGAYGSQLTVIYNFLVKNKGDEKYHLETIEDRIIIPTIDYDKQNEETVNE